MTATWRVVRTHILASTLGQARATLVMVMVKSHLCLVRSIVDPLKTSAEVYEPVACPGQGFVRFAAGTPVDDQHTVVLAMGGNATVGTNYSVILLRITASSSPSMPAGRSRFMTWMMPGKL